MEKMTTKEKLIQEIDQTPDELLDKLLDFVLLTKEQYEEEISQEEQESILAAQSAYKQGNYLTFEEFLAS